jgi:hypothetical protein
MAQYQWGSDEQYAPGQVEAMQARETATAALRAKRAKEQEEAFKAALARYAEATEYSPVISDHSEGPNSLQNLTPWERELLARMGTNLQLGNPYGFDRNKTMPGDQQLILQRLRQMRRPKG